MTLISVDSIIKGILLKKSYPLHFYLQYMVSARDIIHTLTMDDGLIPPNTILLQLDETASARLPDDFIDDIHAGVRVGQLIRPLVRKSSINPLPNINEEGETVPYPATNGNQNFSFGYLSNIFYTTSLFNENGEFLGRLNTGAGTETDVYKIIKERNVIQCHQSMAGRKIVLIYLSNGCGCCDSLGIEPYAKEVVEAYLHWDNLRNKRNPPLGELEIAQQEYFRQRKIYRARKNKDGIEELKRSIVKAYYAAPKVI